jgi:hypothetical protein
MQTYTHAVSTVYLSALAGRMFVPDIQNISYIHESIQILSTIFSESVYRLTQNN